MHDYIIFGIGILAQALFSARILVQWISSERAKKVLSPVIFWQLSLIASFLLIIYGILRNDIVIIGGQAFSYFIYIRNLRLKRAWRTIPKLFRFFTVAFPFMALIYILIGEEYNYSSIFDNKDISSLLLVWGSIGQIIFSLRFIYQWYYSEKIKQSVLPLGFWLISIFGSAMIIIYAILRADPVLIIGQVFGFVVYFRNIIISVKEKKHSKLIPDKKSIYETGNK
ncbi:lipid-A-disaccharide synthase N-terminal domain-containing protein [Bacteroidota bacterium]